MKYLFKILNFTLYLIFLSGITGYAQDLPVACGDGIVRYGVVGQNGTSVFDWEVTGGTIVNNYNDSIDVQWNNVAGIYYIRVTETTAYGCTGETFEDTVVLSVPYVDLGLDGEICIGESFEFTADGTDISTYLWQDGSDAETFIATQDGQYWVRTTDTYGCVASDTATLIVHELPAVDLGNDTTYCGTDALLLDVSQYGIYYDWFDGSISSTFEVYTQTQDQEIWVNVTDEFGCIGTDTVIVRACGELEIPTAFTPNGDNINETWEIDALVIYPECTVDIYSRWGDRVFHSDGYSSDQSWDGKNQSGKELPMDAYYYVIDLNNGEEPIVGTVTIVR